jgi:hypothetical protein
MRTIDVTIHCDWPGCDFAVSESASVGLIFERPISIDGKAEKVFALCKVDNDRFDEILNPLLAKALKSEAKNPRPKRPSSSPAAAGDGSSNGNVSAETLCRVPGCSSPPLKSRAGLGQHVIRTHGYASLADYDTEYINPASISG